VWFPNLREPTLFFFRAVFAMLRAPFLFEHPERLWIRPLLVRLPPILQLYAGWCFCPYLLSPVFFPVSSTVYTKLIEPLSLADTVSRSFCAYGFFPELLDHLQLNPWGCTYGVHMVWNVFSHQRFGYVHFRFFLLHRVMNISPPAVPCQALVPTAPHFVPGPLLPCISIYPLFCFSHRPFPHPPSSPYPMIPTCPPPAPPGVGLFSLAVCFVF